MAKIALKGNPISTVGELPSVGSAAPDFRLTGNGLQDVSLADYAGKTVVLNIVPSLDTGICALSAQRFNQEASGLDNAVILTVSNDLPFAQGRFCQANGIDRVVTLSQLRNRDFGQAYGIEIADGPMAGLLARAVVVVDGDGQVVYTQLVPEIVQEPDYEAVLNFLR
jgi:thiol peroxidase